MIDLFLAPVMAFVYWTPPQNDVVFTTFQNVVSAEQVTDTTEVTTLREIHERRAYNAMLLLTMDAEGTYPNSLNVSPYRIMFTYALFNDYSDHPRAIQCSGDLCSDAAGGYQFLSTTYDGVRQEFNHLDWPHPEYFHPLNQDLAFILYLESGYGGWTKLVDGIQPDGSVSDEAIRAAVSAACGGWASFPCADGFGAYDQPFHSHEWMRDQFNYYLSLQPCADGCGLVDQPIAEE